MLSTNNDQLSLYNKNGYQLKLLIRNVESPNSYSIKIPKVINVDDPIAVLSLFKRVENALIKKGRIKTVGQFINKTDSEIERIPNIGPKILSYLKQVKTLIVEHAELINSTAIESIHESNENGHISSEYIIQDANRTNTIKELQVKNQQIIGNLLEQCNSTRSLDVIIRRYGLRGGDRETLEEIGQLYEVTRERIRQIQVKSLTRMRNINKNIVNNLTKLLEDCLYNAGGLITEEEADKLIPRVFEDKENDGSAMMDLFTELDLIQSTKIGDATIYSPLFGKIELIELVESIINITKNENIGVSLSEIKTKLKILNKINDLRFDQDYFILKYCWVDPRIEEVKVLNSNEIYFRHYTSGNFPTEGWRSMITRILNAEQSPLHFTEITSRLNDMISEPNRKIEVRRVLSLLIESKTFAHVGIRGTYGLTSWGLRKETMPELIEECMKKAGFPLHWRQIYNYISKYKETKHTNLIANLENNNRFIRTDKGVYWLKSESLSKTDVGL